MRRAFHLQRYFSIASGIAILLVTVVMSASYYREEVADEIASTGTRNVMLAQTFANTIWPQYGAHLSRPFASAQALRDDPETRRLHATFRAMTERVSVIKIKIYNPAGIAIYSSVPDEIGEDKSANSGFQLARAGQSVNELTHRGSMSITEGKVENVDVVSTYIPIEGHQRRVDAVFELYSDVTEAVAKVRNETFRLTMLIVLVFAVLYGILLLIVRHADAILRRQVRELKENEEQIQAKNRELDAANRAKSDFLSNMSHELRTPMNAILGFAQLLQSEPGTQLTDHQRNFIEQILKAGRHLLELINEVLDLARIEAGKMTLSLEPLALADVIAECLPLIENMAREKAIAIVKPGVAAEVRVVADYMRLKQSLLNLLSNAVKYNREGGSVQIEVAAAGADRWRIGVTDTGRGIPAHQRAELFQPFHRLGGNVSEVEGTGIGLALTQSLVHAMGGEIGFASESGQGSTFWIELPAARDAAPLAARAAAVAAAEPADVDGERKLLLYIEDNPANVLLMEQIARRMALRFAHAADGASGLSLARAEHPDLIVMDIHLPDISGYEALARLKQDPRTRAIPVMALTANAMRKDVARGIAAGFARYLTKPFEVDELMSAVGEVIEAPR